MAPRLDLRKIAAEIAEIIDVGGQDPRLVWTGRDHVEIHIGDIVPVTNQGTTAARRKRFAGELKLRILPLGWRRIEAGSHLIFERPGGNPFAGKPL